MNMCDCRHRRRVMRKQLFLQHASLFPGITELHSVPPSRSPSLWPMPQTSRPRDSIQSEVNMALDGILAQVSTRSDKRQDEVGECEASDRGSGRHQGHLVTDRQTVELARPLPQVPRRRSRRKHGRRLSTTSKTHTRGRSQALKIKEVRSSIYETLRSLRHREKHGHRVEPPSISRDMPTDNGIEQLLGSSSISPPDSNIHDLNAANVTAWTLDHFPWTSNDNVRQTPNISSEGATSSPHAHDIHRQTSVNPREVDVPPAVVGISGHSMYTDSGKNPSLRVVNISDQDNRNETAPPSVRITDITHQASANSSMRAAPEKPFSDITYCPFPLPPSPELLLNLQEQSTLPLGRTRTASQPLLRPRSGCQHAARAWKSFSGRFPDEPDTTTHQQLQEHHSGSMNLIIMGGILGHIQHFLR